MLIELDQDNYIKIDPEQGCRIQELKIGGKCVVKYDEKDGFLGSGSYLMFPWVNRVVQNKYQKFVKHGFSDGKGYPLHGLFMNTKREAKVEKIMTQNIVQSIKIHIANALPNDSIHSFTQTFTLSKDSLSIQFKCIPSQQDPLPFCFGYHPYLQLSKPLSQTKISTNLNKQLKLQSDLLVKWPCQQQQWKGEIVGTEKYDSLFCYEKKEEIKGQNQSLSVFVKINDGVNELKIQSDLKYWQIYTPDDGIRIAIEPMSFHGNIYQISEKSPEIIENLPNQGTIKISIS